MSGVACEAAFKAVPRRRRLATPTWRPSRLCRPPAAAGSAVCAAGRADYADVLPLDEVLAALEEIEAPAPV
jgi:hypothetical protein